MKLVMNKNIMHNGKLYEKNSVISSEDGNCADFQAAGHTTEVEDDASEQVAPEAKSGFEPIKQDSVAASQPVEQAKPSRKPSK